MEQSKGRKKKTKIVEDGSSTDLAKGTRISDQGSPGRHASPLPCRARTAPFLRRQMEQVLEPWPTLLSSMFVFHVSLGWGNQRRTVAPILSRFAGQRPPLVWLFGPAPNSLNVQQSIQDLLFYLFSEGYSVRWISHCGGVGCDDQARLLYHQTLFSLLACLNDPAAHAVSAVSNVALDAFEAFNQKHGIVLQANDTEPNVVYASRMEAACVSTLQLRAAFCRLMFGTAKAVGATDVAGNVNEVEATDVTGDGTANAIDDVRLTRVPQESISQVKPQTCWQHFFRESRFVSFARNEASLLANSEGYGHDGEFGMVRELTSCSQSRVEKDKNIDTTKQKRKRKETLSEVEWRCSFKFRKVDKE